MCVIKFVVSVITKLNSTTGSSKKNGKLLEIGNNKIGFNFKVGYYIHLLVGLSCVTSENEQNYDLLAI